MKHDFSIDAFGASCVLLNWQPVIQLETHQAVVQMDQFVSTHFQDEVVETIIGYHSLMIQLKAPDLRNDFVNSLKNSFKYQRDATEVKHHLFHLPVCYDAEFGWDIKQLSEEKNKTVSEVIELHTAPTYPVYFIGFLPGFPYLGGLSSQLHTPRKKTPRPKIPGGSVGIGGNQTGIYPQASPGGWNLIGRTPVSLFSKNLQPPALLKAGDRVQFKSIHRDEFWHISEAIQKNEYTIEQEVWHD